MCFSRYLLIAPPSLTRRGLFFYLTPSDGQTYGQTSVRTALSTLSGGLNHSVLSVILMTTYNTYSAYKAALAAGRKNIRFHSLKTVHFAGNPVTCDSGLNCVDSQSGDF